MANKIKKNDKVKVMAGKDKGKIATVVKVYPQSGQLLLENINIIKKHTKPNQKSQQGGIIEKSAPINIAKVMLVCPNCDKPTRVGFSLLKDGNKKVRVCKKCQENIDK